MGKSKRKIGDMTYTGLIVDESQDGQSWWICRYPNQYPGTYILRSKNDI